MVTMAHSAWPNVTENVRIAEPQISAYMAVDDSIAVFFARVRSGEPVTHYFR